MPNPDKLGSGSKLYYQFADYDVTQADATILADATWNELCTVDVSVTRARTLQQIVDRCVGEDNEYVGGKRDTSVSINLNELRLTNAIVRQWEDIADTSGVISLLILDDERTEADVRGMVGNFLVEQDDSTQPSEGANTNARSFKPAARSAFSPKIKRVRGANIA